MLWKGTSSGPLASFQASNSVARAAVQAMFSQWVNVALSGAIKPCSKPQLVWVVAQTVERFSIEPIDVDWMCWADVELGGAQLLYILDQVMESCANPSSIRAADFLMRRHL